VTASQTQFDELAGSGLSPAGTIPSAPAASKRFSKPLLMFCLAFVFVRLPFIFSVPMVEAPDEFAHYWVVKFIAQHLRLPNAAEVAAGGPESVYGSLPQLGYLPHIIISFFAPPHNIALFERFGSLFGGLILLYAAFHIARELFPRERVLQFALPAMIVFHPQLAFVNSYANNDAVSSALSAVLILLVLRSIRLGVEVKRSALVGGLLGWLALSKYSGLAVVPVVASGLIAAAVINRTPIARVAASVVACFAACAATCGWWFARNYHEFHGDLLGTKTMFVSWAKTFNKDVNYHVPASHIIKELRWWRMMYFSFWGMFGYMTRYMWRPVYLIYVGYLGVSFFGLLCILVHTIKTAALSMKNGAVGVAEGLDVRTITSWACLTLTVVVNLAAMIWASTGNLGGPQGRYLFTSEVPVMALLLIGLYRLGGKHGAAWALSLVGFNAVVCVGAWAWLFQLYGFRIAPL
jgi:hypothetical protein